jgi:hypothetical protein
MDIKSNLPSLPQRDSALGTRLYFDKYGEASLEFPAGDIDATVGYLKARGFGDEAALITSVILLKQAKLDQLPVTELLDTLKGLENLELSTLVGEVLNNNRTATSTLGFRLEPTGNENLIRNIVA